MKLMTIMVAAAAASLFGQSAHARTHYRHHATHHHYAHRHVSGHRVAQDGSADWTFGANAEPRHSRTRLGGRPSQWCGWQMRQLVSSDPGQSYNLARNWAHWGSSGPAGVGAVVVWPHHVGKIVGKQNGQWVIQSGNDGHALRSRPRSIAGAIAIRWG